MIDQINANITILLKACKDSLDRFMPIAYDELRSLARRYLRCARAVHTLQLTLLELEVYLKLNIC
jgi:uncharacterized protein (UPF0128 family)